MARTPEALKEIRERLGSIPGEIFNRLKEMAGESAVDEQGEPLPGTRRAAFEEAEQLDRTDLRPDILQTTVRMGHALGQLGVPFVGQAARTLGGIGRAAKAFRSFREATGPRQAKTYAPPPPPRPRKYAAPPVMKAQPRPKTPQPAGLSPKGFQSGKVSTKPGPKPPTYKVPTQTTTPIPKGFRPRGLASGKLKVGPFAKPSASSRNVGPTAPGERLLPRIPEVAPRGPTSKVRWQFPPGAEAPKSPSAPGGRSPTPPKSPEPPEAPASGRVPSPPRPPRSPVSASVRPPSPKAVRSSSPRRIVGINVPKSRPSRRIPEAPGGASPKQKAAPGGASAVGRGASAGGESNELTQAIKELTGEVVKLREAIVDMKDEVTERPGGGEALSTPAAGPRQRRSVQQAGHGKTQAIIETLGQAFVTAAKFAPK